MCLAKINYFSGTVLAHARFSVRVVVFYAGTLQVNESVWVRMLGSYYYMYVLN